MTAVSGGAGSVLPAAKTAGVLLHLTSLPGPYGIGELGAEARKFIDLIAAAGIGVWQFLPTGPTGFGNSPYQALSTFAGNEMLLDTGTLCDRGLLRRDEVAGLHRLPRGRVDFARLLALKPALLQRAAARFAAQASPALRAARNAFVAQNDPAWLHDYALFRVLKNGHGSQPWPSWESCYAQRDPAALRRLQSRHAAAIDAVKSLQYLFEDQWNALHRYAAERRIQLFGDLPIYVAADSADTWANRSLFVLDDDGHPATAAGVPPDYFSADGQLWGNPLYDWARHRADGYDWWLSRLQRALSQVDLLRIDHFRGFEAYWSVPADAGTARTGHWLPGPGRALLDAALDRLGTLPLVAENLGIITPAVEALRRDFGLPGMRVLQFDLADDGFDPATIESNCVCYTGTHDNDTVQGWFRGNGDELQSDDDLHRTRQRAIDLTGATARSAHDALIRYAFASPARLAIAPLQDFLGLGSSARLNTPGTTGDNWTWRMPAALNERDGRHIGEPVHRAGRGPAPCT